MLRVLTLSTLFPDATRPNFGVFVERQTLGLAARRGVELRVVAPLGLPPWPIAQMSHHRALAGLPRRETWKGLDVSRPRFLALPATAGRFHARMLASTLKPFLTRLRRDFPFDVIDAEFFFPDGPAAVALGAHFGVPVSIKARGADIHFWGRAAPTRPQVVAAGEAAAGMLAVSESLKADMVALGLPADRILVHRTGLDLDRFVPRDRARAKSIWDVHGPLVVSVGALIPRKGHEVVIDAVARIPRASLLIAGEGPERPRLAARIARHNMKSRARLLGAVPHESLPPLLAAADVMALASTSEGLANAWVEALGCGTPLVITDAGGARELVTNPDAGRIVARTPEAFAEAIRELIGAPPDPVSVRKAAEPYSWTANAEALHRHLAGLVAQSRG